MYNVAELALELRDVELHCRGFALALAKDPGAWAALSKMPSLHGATLH